MAEDQNRVVPANQAPAAADNNAVPPPNNGEPEEPNNAVNNNVGPAAAQRWVLIGALVVGFLTLLYFSIFGYLAFYNPDKACNAYRYLAPAFALGLGLATAFIGGNAVAKGDVTIPGVRSPIAVGVGGGAAVVIIALIIFSSLAPKCTVDSTDVRIQGFPSKVLTYVDDNHYYKRVERNLKYGLTILTSGSEKSNTAFVTVEGEGSAECSLSITRTDDLNAEKKKHDADYEFTDYNTTDFLLDYVSSGSDSDENKETVGSCTEWVNRNKAIYNIVLISPYEGKVAIATGPKKPNNEVIAPVSLIDSQGQISLVASAFAQDLPVQFSEITNSLSSPDDNVRVAARRHLARNFKNYSAQVVAELKKATESTNPAYVADLLSALIGGMGTENPDILPGRGIKPGEKRTFSTALPFISGSEKKIIELAGFPDPGVKKQARRLVQRYPFDGFKILYDKLVSDSLNCAALAPFSEREQAELYSSIFFYYNRIIDHNYSATLSNEALSDARESAKKAIDASMCLPKELKVDAAVVYYGLALIYSQDKGKPKLEEARKEARIFLKHIFGMESKYYLQFHVEEMRRLSGGSAPIN